MSRRRTPSRSPFEVRFVSGLEQQRNINDRRSGYAEQLEAAESRPSMARYTAGWTMPRGPAARRIREHQRPELRAIDAAVGGEHVGAEARGDRRVASVPAAITPCAARRRRGTATPRAETGRARGSCPSRCRRSAPPSACVRPAEAGRYVPHVSLPIPAALAAAVSVFLSSIAIVSGPTPPGTGVSAPATSATSGCTSPDHDGPARSNASRRFEPAGNSRSTVARSATRLQIPTSMTVAPGLDEARASRTPAGRWRRPGCRPPRATAGQVRRARMTDRHGGVAMQQQQRHRLADDVAAPDHDGAGAGDRNPRSLQQLDDAGRRARHEVRAILHEPADVDRMKPSTSLSGRIASNTRRSASAPIAAGSGDCTRMPSCTSLAFRRSTTSSSSSSDADAGSDSRSARRPASPADFSLLPHVDLRRRVVADQHDSEPGRPAVAGVKRFHRQDDLGSNLAGHRGAVEQAAPPSVRPRLQLPSRFKRIGGVRARPACRRR